MSNPEKPAYAKGLKCSAQSGWALETLKIEHICNTVLTTEYSLNNQWFSKIAVWLVIAMVLFTVFKQFDTRAGASATYVGYSDFLDEVRGRQIKTATIDEGQGCLLYKSPSPRE